MDNLRWRNLSLPGIALGTVQLGLPYGIANTSGQPDFELARQIIRAAWEKGIRCFDTAQAYGESERVLGQALRSLNITKEAQVITKLDPELQSKSTEEIFSSIEHSRKLLGVSKLFGVMLHRGDWLREWQKYGPALGKLQKKEVASFIGVSIYSEAEIELALGLPEIDLIQAPFNVFDQRADRLKWFEKARQTGKLIFTRSVFLQGLLLIPLDNLPLKMEFARKPLEKYRELCLRSRLSPAALALGYVAYRKADSVILLGAETPSQIKENYSFYHEAEIPRSIIEEIDDLFSDMEPKISNPSLWPK